MKINYGFFIILFVVLSFNACSQFQRTFYYERQKSLIVLAKNDKKHNAIVVSTLSGTQKIDKPRAFVGLQDKGMSKVLVMSKREFDRRFSKVMNALPPKAQSFILYLKKGKMELDSPSKALLCDIVSSILKQAPCMVDVIGHTDTVGTNEQNIEASFSQAQYVQDILKKRVLKHLDSLKPIQMMTKGYGEEDLLISTDDEQEEERNRNIEVVIR